MEQFAILKIFGIANYSKNFVFSILKKGLWSCNIEFFGWFCGLNSKVRVAEKRVQISKNILEYGNMILNHMNIFIKILRVIFFLPDFTYLHMNKNFNTFSTKQFCFSPQAKHQFGKLNDN